MFIRRSFCEADFINITDIGIDSPIGFFIPRSQILSVDTTWNCNEDQDNSDPYSARIRIELSNGKP